MKDKILQQLKTKYSNLGLSVKTLEGFAEQLATTVTEETQIEGAVQGAEFYLKIAQAEADRVRQDAKKNTPPEPPKPEPPKTETNNDTPEWAKGFQERMELITKELSTLKSEKTSTSRRSLLEQKIEKANPTLKAKILKDFSRMNFETEDQFTDYLTETESDVSSIIQGEINRGLSNGKPIVGGGKVKGEPSEAELDAVMQNI